MEAFVIIAAVMCITPSVNCQQGIPINLPTNISPETYQKLVSFLGSVKRPINTSKPNATVAKPPKGDEVERQSKPSTNQVPTPIIFGGQVQTGVGMFGNGRGLYPNHLEGPTLGRLLGVTPPPKQPSTTSSGDDDNEGAGGGEGSGTTPSTFATSYMTQGGSGLPRGWDQLRLGPMMPAWSVIRIQRNIIDELKRTVGQLMNSGCNQYAHAIPSGLTPNHAAQSFVLFNR